MNARATKARQTGRRWTSLVTLVVVLLAVPAASSGCFGRGGFITIGTAIDILPSREGTVTVRVGTGRYFYHRGVFYQPYRGGYLVVAAPLGAVIPRPPGGHVLLVVENDPFVYYRGVFYQPIPAGYVVTRAPMGAFVRRLPPGAVVRWVDGVEYKEYAGAWYRPAIRDGADGWQVTEPPERR